MVLRPPSGRKITATIATACTLGAASALGMAAPALAHDAVVRSQPDSDATVRELPEEIVLDFSGQPQEGFNTISVSRDGEVLFRGEPRAEGQELTLPVPDDVESVSGTYTVGYQITSSDGHATRGGYEFVVDNPDSPAGDAARAGSGSDESASATEVSDNSDRGDAAASVPSWLLPVGGIVVIVGALAIAIKRYRELGKD